MPDLISTISPIYGYRLWLQYDAHSRPSHRDYQDKESAETAAKLFRAQHPDGACCVSPINTLTKAGKRKRSHKRH
jgi:hypothetical protein